MEGVGGGGKVHGGRDANYGFQLWRGARTEVPGELKDEVAAHAVADERKGLQVLETEKVAHNRLDIGGHA